MTVETNDIFAFVESNGFKNRWYKCSAGMIRMDYSGPYNIRRDYRSYRYRNLCIEFDFEWFAIYKGEKKIFKSFLSDKPGWGNELPINYKEIPEEAIYFIVNKQFKPIEIKKKVSRYISTAIRKLIFILFDNKCNFCGSVHKLQIDHIHPVSKGGKNTKENLQLLCQLCNLRKRDKILPR